MIIAQNAPLAAAIQAGMIRGTIPADDAIIRVCDSILDRICGKARQQVDLFHNADGLARLDAYATWLQVQRSDSIDGLVKQLPETTS
jgi:hypothetical protein